MKINEVMPSTNFEDNYQKAVINIHYTYGWLNDVLRGEFKKFNLTAKQFNMLNILREQYPIPASVNLLNECMTTNGSAVSPIIYRLVQKGLVSRNANTKDRRVADIRISDQGMEILSNLDVEI